MQIAISAYESAKAVVVPDSTTAAIDRVFDLVDSFADKVDHAINRGKRTEEQHRARRAKRQPVMIDTAATVKVDKVKPKPETAEAPTSSTALATRPRFRIIEAVAAESGQTIFVVTNGSPSARAECSTRELAEKILRALESAP